MLLSSCIFSRAGALATHPPLAERIRRIYGRPMAPLHSAVQPVAAEPAPARPDMVMAFAGVADDRDPSAVVDDAVAGSLIPATAAATATSAAHAPISPGDAPAAWLDNLLAIDWPHDLVPATLAFLVPAEHGPEHAAWCLLFARPASGKADRSLRQAWQLPAAARQGAFERLLTRCASLPPAERAQLRQQAHQIVRADARLDFAEIFHCLLLDHVLELRHESVLRERHCLSLVQCAPAIACMTDLLAAQRFPGHADAAGLRATWRAEIGAALALDALPASAQVPALPAITGALRQLADLSWMLRPQLMKAWCALVLRAQPPAPQAVVDALRAVCILIDTPMPPALQAFYPEHAASDLRSDG
jgi:hypothetical protein